MYSELLIAGGMLAPLLLLLLLLRLLIVMAVIGVIVGVSLSLPLVAVRVLRSAGGMLA